MAAVEAENVARVGGLAANAATNIRLSARGDARGIVSGDGGLVVWHFAVGVYFHLCLARLGTFE